MRNIWILVLLAACAKADYRPDNFQYYDDTLNLDDEMYDMLRNIDNINQNAPDSPQDTSKEAIEESEGLLNVNINDVQPNFEEAIKEPEYEDDYQIEDNRLEVKESVNEAQNAGKDDDFLKSILENDGNVDEAQQDFDAFQQILGDKENIGNDIEEKILYVDEQSLTDLKELSSENKNNDETLVLPPLLDDNKTQQETLNESNNNSEEISIPEDDNNEEISKISNEDDMNNFNVENKSDNGNSLSNIDENVDKTKQISQESDINQIEGNDKIANEEGFDNVDEILIPEDDNNEEISKISDEDIKDDFSDQNISIMNSQPNIDKIIEETQKLLEDNDDQFENRDTDNDNSENISIPEDDNNEKISQISDEEKLLQIVNSQLNIDEIVSDSHKAFEDPDNQLENNKSDIKTEISKQLDTNSKQNQEEDNNEEISKASDENNSNTEEKLLEIINSQLNVNEIVDETREVLQETNNQFESNELKNNKENVEELKSNEDNSEILDKVPFENSLKEPISEEVISDKETVKNIIDLNIPQIDMQFEVKGIIDETNRLLDETADKVNINIDINEQNIDQAQSVIGSQEMFNENDDDSEKVYKDLNDHLDNLLETWNKLSNDDFEENNSDAAIDNEHVLDYEEKYGRPFGEGKVLSQRDDYYESINDDELSKVFSDVNSDEIKSDNNETIQKISDDENKENDAQIAYVNDALSAGEKEDQEKSERSQIEDKEPVKAMSVENLSSAELDQLMSQFSILHSEDFDMKSYSFDKNVAPIHIKLSVDEPIVITSPNYPKPYPTNNIIDWVFDGEGVGIELNITDFNVNSALGDYLLVKPGSVDSSGDNGLVFAYHLNEERRYRFMDVDQLFIRFESKPGMMLRTGFKLSVKMIAPPEEEPEEMPEPEPILPQPDAIMTLYLAGVNVTEFEEIKEEFRLLLANMASMYINANGIELGLNDTIFVTQITRTYICNINWPGFDNCVEVQFSVPLVYDDDREPRLNESDLKAMWYTYATRDPFATRLKYLGVSEFTTPDDGTIILMWLVLAAAVLITVMMLAFALWRFSCFENYTRMQTYSDTDSLHNEKQSLDMYPTPHQTLPPLFTESNYKWHDNNFEDTTRVDMGGFTNRTYVRDDLTDESEEEVVVSRETFHDKKRSASSPKAADIV